jgi:hypothetical protein
MMAMLGKPLLSVFAAAAIAWLSPAGAWAQNENSWYPLKADGGSDVVNYRVPVDHGALGDARLRDQGRSHSRLSRQESARQHHSVDLQVRPGRLLITRPIAAGRS